MIWHDFCSLKHEIESSMRVTGPLQSLAGIIRDQSRRIRLCCRGAGMKTKARRRVRENEPLQYQEKGKGFIVSKPIGGIPAGRMLVQTFTDQFNRLYVQVNGELQLVTEGHAFLDAN